MSENDTIKSIRERMLRYRGVKYSFVKGMRYAHDVEILLGELADSSAELDRLTAENAALKQRVAQGITHCKDCEFYNTNRCADGFGWCQIHNRGEIDEHYCERACRRAKEESNHE